MDATDFHVEAIDLLSNDVPCESGIALLVAIYSAVKRHSVLAGLLVLGDQPRLGLAPRAFHICKLPQNTCFLLPAMPYLAESDSAARAPPSLSTHLATVRGLC